MRNFLAKLRRLFEARSQSDSPHPTSATHTEALAPDVAPADVPVTPIDRETPEHEIATNEPLDHEVAEHELPDDDTTSDVEQPTLLAEQAAQPIQTPAEPMSVTPAQSNADDLTSAAVEVESLQQAATAGDVLVLTLQAQSGGPTMFRLAKSGATLGRADDNTIKLSDLSVSRKHARIAFRQGGYWLSDVGSIGGTWVDGTRINAAHRLAAGQLIDIGLLRLTVSFAGEVSAKVPHEQRVKQARRRRG